jgi:glycosyltransferase involved in cell wall biosynthesis
MMQFSILIPQRNADHVLAALVPQLDLQLARDGKSYEIICIDDSSNQATLDKLAELRLKNAALRIVKLKRPSGFSAALTIGIQAAQGEVVVLFEPSGQYRVEQIAHLVERLARADLVCGRRQSGRLAKMLLALAQAPRRLLLGLEVRDPDCLFWAARREALAGIELLPGMHRFLGSLVTTRGFRVTEMHVDHAPGRGYRVGMESWPRLGNLLVTCWQRWSYRSIEACELDSAQALLPLIDPVPQRDAAATLPSLGDDRAAA